MSVILLRILSFSVFILLSNAACPKIISRQQWGARTPILIEYLNLPVSKFFIHHGESRACNNTEDCMSVCRSIQNFHMDTNGWNDIGYSFLVGEDGNVYEGRGFDRVGAHTLGHNTVALAICVIGDFRTVAPPNSLALNAVKSMLNCLVDSGYLTRDYVLGGHRDVVLTTTCPGDKLYDIIKTWPNFGYAGR